MNLEIQNKNALVCGSTAGIGKATAILLAKEGANVTLIARNEEKLKSVLQELSKSNEQNHQSAYQGILLFLLTNHSYH
jgi:3-oxoacyl-[acyl-carrier protein] reductase